MIFTTNNSLHRELLRNMTRSARTVSHFKKKKKKNSLYRELLRKRLSWHIPARNLSLFTSPLNPKP